MGVDICILIHYKMYLLCPPWFSIYSHFVYAICTLHHNELSTHCIRMSSVSKAIAQPMKTPTK